MATSVVRPPAGGGDSRERPSIVASFDPIEGSRGAFTISVYTNDWKVSSVELFARVGNQPVIGLTPFIRGGGFAGRLDRPPNEGDRLYLRYAGGFEDATPVVYRSTPPRRDPNVA